MKLIKSKRGEGKTSELVKKCYELNQINGNLTYIVCANRNLCLKTMEVAEHLGLNIPFPMTMDELFGSNSRGTFIKNILFDDFELCLKEILPERFTYLFGTFSEESFSIVNINDFKNGNYDKTEEENCSIQNKMWYDKFLEKNKINKVGDFKCYE